MVCKAEGFNGFAFDNLDALNPDYKNGLDLVDEDEVAFSACPTTGRASAGCRWRSRNDIPHIPSVLRVVDFVVNKRCVRHRERLTSENCDQNGCDQIDAVGKPVFETEYAAYSPKGNVCAASVFDGFSTTSQPPALDSYRVSRR